MHRLTDSFHKCAKPVAFRAGVSDHPGASIKSLPRRHTLQTLVVWALASGGLPTRAAEVWISGNTRGRSAVFATEALSNLPEGPARAALPRMVQLLWTFDPAGLPDSKELDGVRRVILANAQGLVKEPQSVRLVATGRAPEGAFWCLYTPEAFKVSALVDSLAGFDGLDPAMALRLRNRVSWVERRDPNWTWIEALLREMGRK